MKPSRSRISSWKRHSVILLVLGIVLGQLTYHIITSLLRRGQRFSCTLPAWTLLTNEGKSRLVGREHNSATNSKELLFVGVMTSRRYLGTRARAIHATWGSALNGSLMFFVGDGDKVEEDLPVQILHTVKDSEYPPRRKSFAMLQFMHKEYGQHYEWFMRVDDDLFVDVQRLRLLLSSVNSSLPLYIGHPGTGKPEEAGQLGLPAGVPYCMGGTGVVLSSPLLTSVAGLLATCAQSTVTDHEDSELGRCVFNASGLGCLQSKQIYRQFKQNYDDTSGEWVRKTMQSSQPYVTFHPVKDTRYIYDSATLMDIQRVAKLETKVRQLTATIACIDQLFHGFEQNETASTQSDCANGQPCSLLDISQCHFGTHKTQNSRFENVLDVSWFLIHQNTFYTFWKNDLRKPVSYGGVLEGLTKILRHLSSYVKENNRHHSRLKKQTVLESFYRRVIPAVGVEYVAFVRDTSSDVRPYVIRESFDQPVPVEKR